MSITRKVAAVAMAGVLAGGMAACSSPESTGDDGKTITIWHNAADPEAIKNLYSNFTDDTGIKVDLVSVPTDAFETTVQTKWATGDRPDILEYHPTTSHAATLNAGENMQDLTDMPFVENSGDLYDYAGRLNDKVYAAITGLPSVFGVYFNKAAFESAGVAVPQNFNELLASCAPLKAAGITPFYESGQSQWPLQILPSAYVADQNTGGDYGDALRNNEESITDPEGPFMKGLAEYEELRDECFQKDYSTGTFENAISEVYAGTTAMTALHSDTYNLWVDAAGGDEAALSDAVGFSGMSSESTTAWFGPAPLGSYYAPKTGNAVSEKAALSFIEYATGDGYQALVDDAKSFPVIEGFTTPDGISPLKQTFKDTFDDGATIGFSTDVIGFGDVFGTEMNKLLNKQATAQQVAESIKANVEKASTAAGVEGW